MGMGRRMKAIAKCVLRPPFRLWRGQDQRGIAEALARNVWRGEAVSAQARTAGCLC